MAPQERQGDSSAAADEEEEADLPTMQQVAILFVAGCFRSKDWRKRRTEE